MVVAGATGGSISVELVVRERPSARSPVVNVSPQPKEKDAADASYRTYTAIYRSIWSRHD